MNKIMNFAAETAGLGRYGLICCFVATGILTGAGLPLLKAVAADELSAPCISIGSIVSAVMGTSAGESDNRTVAVRDHLASELMNRYECTVLSRCRGYDVAVERSIAALAGINDLKANTATLPAADYVITANFMEAQTRTAITGTVFCASIRPAGTNDVVRRVFFAETTLDAAESMADAVGVGLALVPRKKAQVTASSKGQVWAVFPFTRMESKNVFDHELSLRVEAALQGNGSGIKLVDRNLLEKVMTENNIQTLSGASGVTAGMIGRLLSADILVVGQVSMGKKDKRLDIHFLDGKTGCILAAQVARDVAPDQLVSAAVKLSAEVAGAGIAAPRLRDSTREERLMESALLLNTDMYPATVHSDGATARTRWSSAVSSFEGSYLLVNDNPVVVYTNMVRLMRWFATVARGVFKDDYNALPGTSRAIVLVEAALKNVEVGPQTPAVLVLRAENALYARKYDECLALLEKHGREHPGLEDDYARRVMVQYKTGTGKVDEAEALMKQVKEDSFTTLAMNMDIQDKKARKSLAVSASQGEKEEYAALEKIFSSFEQVRSFKRSEHYGRMNALLKYLELMRKIESPETCLKKAESFSQSPAALECLKGGYDMLPVPLHQALCNLASGRKKEAAAICMHIVEAVDAGSKVMKYAETQKIRQEAADIVAKVTAEVGPVDDAWKTFAQVKPLPATAGFYLVPIGKMRQEILDKTVAILGETFGVTVKALSAVAVPAEALPVKEGGFLQVAPLYHGVTRAVSIPADAVFAAFVTGERLPYPVRLDGRFEYAFNPYMGSYHDRWNKDTEAGIQSVADAFAWRVMAMVTYPERKKAGSKSGKEIAEPCRNFPCIFSGHLSGLVGVGHQYRLYKMCPACQEEWLTADFDKIHRDLTDSLKKAGAKIVPVEK